MFLVADQMLKIAVRFFVGVGKIFDLILFALATATTLVASVSTWASQFSVVHCFDALCCTFYSTLHGRLSNIFYCIFN